MDASFSYKIGYFFAAAFVYLSLGGQIVDAQPSVHESGENSPQLDPIQPAPARFCLTDNWYTTQPGDTCGSIAKDKSVSAAYLYLSNQDLVEDCSNVEPGLNICLPMTCRTYELQPEDICRSLKTSAGAFHEIPDYNSWLNTDCSNMRSATDFYGKTICVSPQGGAFPKNKWFIPKNLIPDRIDGYSDRTNLPPDGVPVAEGTARSCGKWHVVTAEDSCVQICLANGIYSELFHQVNPSLGAVEGCDASLKVGTALCAGPYHAWDDPRFNGSISHDTLYPTPVLRPPKHKADQGNYGGGL